jgi:excinuclease UvrABC ATPase subunit
MVDAVKGLEEGTALMLLAPVVRERKGEYTNYLNNYKVKVLSVRVSMVKSLILIPHLN